MKLAPLGVITTGIVLVVGIILIMPYYMEKKEPTPVVLSFVISHVGDNDNNSSSLGGDSYDISTWCNDLAGILEADQVKAMVFVSGEVAQAHPECVSSFSKLGSIDVGSQTFSYVSLPSLNDYSVALKEVQDGKKAVDVAGGIDSKLFRAPNSLTDANIYSLLQRSGIVADFSYADHYNRYENDQFVRYPVTRVENPPASKQLFDSLSASDTPSILEFDNSVRTSDIHQFISELKSATAGKVLLVGASDLVDRDLAANKKGGGGQTL